MLVAWARCSARMTRVCAGTSLSRCCRRRLPPTRDRFSRFEREARLLATLNHPNIAAIHGLEYLGESGAPVLVLELVPGETLAERIAGRPLPLQTALTYARQIADALDAAHERGIVHRDLKPANIKVTPDGLIKVLDFGLARSTVTPVGTETDGPTVTEDRTHAGVIMGTPGYMSPEQARGLAVDKRTDIWAFGCVLYEMLTASRAFGGATTSDSLAAVLEREPDWAALPATTPPQIVRVLHQCLDKNQTRRRRDIADVRQDLEDAAHAATSGPVSSHCSPAAAGAGERRWPTRVAYLLAALLIGAGGGALALSRIRPARAPQPPERIELTVLPPPGTFFPLEIGAPWPSISPDGRQLAFVAITADGVQQLWMRPLDSATARPLSGTEGAARPFWSPGSDAIGFFADGKIKTVGLPNGVPQIVCDAPYLGGMSATWGKGVILFAHVGGLFRVPAMGGRPELVLPDVESGDNRNSPQNPSFLPDGRQFLYVTQRTKVEDDEICVGSLDSSAPRCVARISSPARYAEPGYVLYLRDGALRLQPFALDSLAFSGESIPVAASYVNGGPVYRPPPFSIAPRALAYRAGTGLARSTWVDRTGRVVAEVGETGDSGAAVSADGSRLIVSRTDPQSPGNVDLWMRNSAGLWSRFTFDPAPDTSPVFSPDASQVVFARARGGNTEFWVKPTTGLGSEQRLLSLPPTTEGSPHDWSADGKWILYGSYSPSTGWDIGRIPASGSGQAELLIHSRSSERDGALSPDMHLIAYDSTESGRREVWVEPMPPNGSRWQVSTGGGANARWRGDGRELFYTSADGTVVAVPVAPGPIPAVGAPVRLFRTMRREGGGGLFKASRDGQRFLVSAPPPLAETDPITVIVNWASVLNPDREK